MATKWHDVQSLATKNWHNDEWLNMLNISVNNAGSRERKKSSMCKYLK